MTIGVVPAQVPARRVSSSSVIEHGAGSTARRWAASRFGGLPREYWLLAAGAGLFRLGFFVIPFRAFYLSSERHLSVTAASAVMVAFGVGWAASQPLGGWLADRVGRRAVITTGAFASAGAFLAFGSARGFAWLALTACAAGLTFDLYRPALSALTTDVVPEPAQRKKALAVLYLTLNVGRGAACIVGGIVASHAFWPLFVANAVINVLFGIAVYHGVRSERSPRMGAPPLRLTAAFKDRRLLVFTAITLVFYCVHMQSVIALPLVIAEHGAKPLQFGLLLALDPLVVAGVQLALQHRLLTTTALHACAAGVALVGVGLAVAGTGSGISWYAATMPLWIAGEVIFLAVAQDVVAALAPPERVGSYFGLWGLSQGLAALLAPIVATVLIGLGGTWLLWMSGAALGIAAAAACLVLQRHQQRHHTGSSHEGQVRAHRTRYAGITHLRQQTLPQPCQVQRTRNRPQRNLFRPGPARPPEVAPNRGPRRWPPSHQRRDTFPARRHESRRPQPDRRISGAVRRSARLPTGLGTRPGPIVTAPPRRWRLPAADPTRDDPPDRIRKSVIVDCAPKPCP